MGKPSQIKVRFLFIFAIVYNVLKSKCFQFSFNTITRYLCHLFKLNCIFFVDKNTKLIQYPQLLHHKITSGEKYLFEIFELYLIDKIEIIITCLIVSISKFV